MEKFDWKLTIKTNILGLKVLGLWPDNNEGYKVDFYTLYAVAFNGILAITNVFFQIMNIFMSGSDDAAFIEILSISIEQVLALIKSYSIVRNIKMLKQLLFAILESNEFQPKNMNQIALIQPALRSWKMIYNMFMTAAVHAVILWAVFPVLDGSFKEHKLPFSAWYPFRIDRSPVYEMIYVHQIVGISVAGMSALNVDMLISALMVYIGAQCDILCDHLKNIGYSMKEDYEKQLIETIKHHKSILSKNCNKFFNFIILAQFFTSTATIALALFQVALYDVSGHQFYSGALVFTAAMVQTFTYCWFGNEVEVKVNLLDTDRTRNTDYRLLPFPCWYPFNVKKSPLYQIVYAHQMASFILIATSVVNLLISALMMYVGIQCDILCDNLRNFGYENGDEIDFEKFLIVNIKHHQKVKVSWANDVVILILGVQSSEICYAALKSTGDIIQSCEVRKNLMIFMVRSLRLIGISSKLLGLISPCYQLLLSLNGDIFQPKNLEQILLVQPNLNSWKMMFNAFKIPAVSAVLLCGIIPVFSGSYKRFGLPFPSWYPFDIKKSPLYQIVYTHQIVSVTLLAIAIVNIDMLISALMMYIATQCDILCDNLRNIGYHDSDEIDFEKSLKSSIRHHQHIL
ncbi:7tm 6 domain containing protein, partial [Asbolus verrucosus]